VSAGPPVMRAGSKSRPGPQREPDSPGNDTLIRGLTREQRARLVIDAWEPTLLRNLLQAEGREVRRAKPPQKA
jgi:hypothetical protein